MLDSLHTPQHTVSISVCVHIEKNCTSGQCVECDVNTVHHKSWTHPAGFGNRSNQSFQFQTYNLQVLYLAVVRVLIIVHVLQD